MRDLMVIVNLSHSGGESLNAEERKSSQSSYNATGTQRQRCHTLVECRYGNGTTLTDVYRSDTDKFSTLPTRTALQKDTNHQRTVCNDERLLRAQLVASADCIYCRYGSLDACRPPSTADDVGCRHDSVANIPTDSL